MTQLIVYKLPKNGLRKMNTFTSSDDPALYQANVPLSKQTYNTAKNEPE